MTLEALLKQHGIPKLPRFGFSSRLQSKIDISGEIWRVGEKRLDWRDLAMVHPLVLHLMKLFIIRLIENKTEDTVHKNYRRMIQAFGSNMKFEHWEHVNDEEMLRCFEGAVRDAMVRLSKSTVKQIKTCVIKFLDFIQCFDPPFYSEEFAVELKSIAFKGDVPLRAVMTLDPDKGPLSRIEEYVLTAGLYNEVDTRNLRDASIVALMQSWGLRPRQIGYLNAEDFVVSSQTSDVTYMLRVCRVKQQQGRVRAEYKLRKLPRQVGELLQTYLAASPSVLLPDSEGMLPLFRNEGLGYPLAGERLSAKVVGGVPQRFVSSRALVSPFGEQPLKISATRLRLTFGTRCAEMPGMTKEILAEMLDHGSTRSLEVYFDFRESIAHEIGALVAQRSGYGTLRDVLERFKGIEKPVGVPARIEYPLRFIRNLKDATDARPEAIRYAPPELVAELSNMPELGACGGGFRCKIAPLLTCYSCWEFEPLVEGDHQSVAEFAEREQRRAIESGNPSDAAEFELAALKARYIAAEALLRRTEGTVDAKPRVSQTNR